MCKLVKAAIAASAVISSAKLIRTRTKPKFALAGKTVLITGGSRGLGLALAKEFGKTGCQIAICARDEAELDRAADQLAHEGIEVSTFPCDVTSQADIESLLSRLVERLQRIDILINNAGLITVAPLKALEKADFERAMDLMFWAPVNTTLAALPLMRAQGAGIVVNITSIGGRVSVPRLLPYSCAKFALVGFSTGLGSEVYRQGIHVVTAVPGLMRTGSYVSAEFKGSAEREFTWFSLLGNAPGFSVSADYAARQVRRAVEQKRHVCNISVPAKLMIASEALFPEITRSAMQAIDRFALPQPQETKDRFTGKMLLPSFGPLRQALTTLGRRAARAYNE